ncbi:MAG: hypothetical protein PHE89_03625 [Alphaproteobacteria bacterium]|nr:hypothetical protein [Alphaproteobacteria bacterium]
MLKKLIEGKLSLGETFWKFGVLGLTIVNVISVISGKLLSAKLGSVSIVDFYTKYFHPLRIDNSVIVVTVFNIASLVALVLYSFIILLATWRSAKAYDKSVWLSFVAKASMFLIVFVCLYTNL